jgi:PAS domain S-box-containing protein
MHEEDGPVTKTSEVDFRDGDPMTEALPSLEANADLVRRVLDASLNGVYVHDLKQGVNTFINAQYTRLTGYDLPRLAAMDAAAFFALFHPEDQGRVSTHMAGLRDAGDGEVLEIEYRFRRADGTWIWCLSRDAVFERDADGSVRSVIGTFLDVSARKRAEAERRTSDAKARRHLEEIELIYDSAPIGLCVLDRHLRYVRINHRLAEINGVPAAEHIGRTIREVLPELAAEVEPRLRRVIETGEPALDMEISGETPARPGIRRTWIESWRPLQDDTGAVAGVNIVTREVTDERAHLQALARSREDYRLVADYTYDWEDWYGPDAGLLWMSPSCHRLTGYPPDAFLADPRFLERITHPEDRAALHEHLYTGFFDPEPKRLRFRIVHANGETRWMEHLCQPVFREGGEFAGRRGSTRDITDARRAEEALRRREQELATLAENSPDIIARFDAALRHLYVNAAVEQATGLAPSRFLGKTNEEVGMPPGLCRRWSATLREVFESGEPQHLEFPFPAPDGERFFSMRAVPERGPDGAIESVLCTTRDETERRNAEARAQSLAKVVEGSGDFIGIARPEGQVLYVNRAGQSLVGLDGDGAVRSTSVDDYFFPEDLPAVHEIVLPEVLRDGRWSGHSRFRHFLTGAPIEVHSSVLRIDDPDTGQPVQIATVTRDVRKERAAEAALLEANRRKDDFLAMLGHELRNPMAPIRNAVEILQLLTQDRDPQVDWAISVLDRQTAHLSRLLDDLLDVSRIVRGTLELKRRPVALREVMQQAVDGVRALMDAHRHRLSLELPAGDVLVDGDPVRLSQILLNLLLNAGTYTPDEGDIRLTATADAEAVRVVVQDNGPGIPPERLEALFAPFSQGEHPASVSGGGLGLGLTISRRLAELHGGRLRARSDWPTPGSEFTLHLPRLRQPQQHTVPRPPKETTPRQPLPVLIVDDNADVSGALAMLLEVLGYRVRTAGTGAEALARANRDCPRVALIDIGLPDMDGLEVARRLRASYPDRDRLVLVAITGYGHDEARRRSLAAGFDEHLAKPVDLTTLRALLDSLQD